ncbi:MAG: molybdopterin-dependent oxidoreductase [Acidobacteriota bacterium]|jgi:aldehyde oxidoreductase|nr:molybdopterin-dependent oxidoreductase [Acidobacteriota bacterium]
MNLKKITLYVNGVDRMIICDPAKDSLAAVLRRIGLTGVKVGCGTGVCGACSVILNGEVVRSCARKISTIKEYSQITTIEGIGTPQHLHPLQVGFMNLGAVQCGFCSPGFIVSAYALLQKNQNPSREDVRDWFQKHRNVCRCTGYKQIVDAVMAAAKVVRGEASIEDITFKLPGDGNYYGKPLVRPAALPKVCGLADYGDDMAMKMPQGTLHAVLTMPRIAHHAKIKNIDTSEAEKMPGVVKVVTHKDIKGTNYLNLVNASKRSTTVKPAHVIFAYDKIYRYGDPVGAVVADTEENARAAAARVKVEIEQLPEYLNYLDAVLPDAVRVHDDTPNICIVQPVLKGAALENPGAVSEIIDNSAFKVEGSFYSTREPHLSIEGDTVQAYFDPDGVMCVHCKAQVIGANIGNIAKSVGLPNEKVRIIMNHTGGSFGWSMNGQSYAAAAACAMAVEKPVALHFTYEEHQLYSGKRSASFSNSRLGCDKDGKITAVEFDIGLDHGAYQDAESIVNRPARFIYFPYNIPHVAGISRLANTNQTFGVAYRGFGAPQAYTASEAMMDMLAEKAGIDPFEFRWRNIARTGETNINSYPFFEYPMEEIMNKMRPLYEKAVADARAADTPAVRRGVGIAWGGYNVSSGPQDEAKVAIGLNEDGTFTKYDTWQDVGQGGDIGSLMVTLEALKPLGVKPGQIKLVQNDSGLCPLSGSSSASRMHFMTSIATKLAADRLIDAMKKLDGTCRTYKEMVAEGIPTKYEAQHSNTTFPGLCNLDPNTGIGNPTPAYCYSMYLAEVAVDTATGKTTVLRFTCVGDDGVIGNIDALDGQIYGGNSHCIGFALSEIFDDVKVHTNMFKCGVPYIKDIPDDMPIIHLETYRKENVFGSSGASENYQSGGHVAVINAIKNACGVRVYELPATSEKVKAGIDALAAGRKIDPPGPFFLGSDLIEELENIKANPV